MLFKEAVDLLGKRAVGKKGDLPAVRSTAAVLGIQNPPFKIIHIAGTNGKGTTSCLTAAALSASGFKTGLFTSPHIYDITERIKIDGKNINKKDFAKYTAAVLKAEPQKLKFFEVITLASLKYFTDKKVDYAVLECGIGGLLDSTNFITPVLSIITSIGLDHTTLLGDNLPSIAAQKAGIIKPRVPCICGPIGAAAGAVIKNTAKHQKSKLYTPVKFKAVADYKNANTVLEYEGTKIPLNLLGRAQSVNAAIVLRAAEVLGLPLTAVKKAFKNIHMPCRFELIKNGKYMVIADGAHNPAAVEEFLFNFKKTPYAKRGCALIAAFSADKDYQSCAKMLGKQFDDITITSTGARGVDLRILAQGFNKPVKIAPNPAQIDTKNIKKDIVILGSFYLFPKIKLA